ncbi:hypothetical protein SCP_0700330 [Sparassis crispa]|uniref:Uncharacterized protein n=1 Tax=Sparassis crispa TaxID=139825 RepID=A0A401GRL7_9APHY|nr:hypothetical protein SCP_0700330 [Sparassis crispa]GBE84853.1 hypothetical protein SCP_0700330 [Sparassis crispa]
MRPDASTTWTAGYTAEVTWDTTNMLSGSASSTGTIFLGHLNDGSDNEHLDLDNPLADGFKMTMGQIEIEVPRVSPGNNYIVVLMGDSGNRSPTFTIQ